MAFGLMLQSEGYGVGWAILMSMTIYAGSGQYLGVSLLATGATLGQTAFLTLMVNFRHLVYGLSMLEKFRGMGRRKLYMIFSLTDETYALLSSAKVPQGVKEHDYYFAVALLDQSYWVLGSVIGSLLGAALGFDTTGVDFAMSPPYSWSRRGPMEDRRQPSACSAGRSGHSGQPAGCGGGGDAAACLGNYGGRPGASPSHSGGAGAEKACCGERGGGPMTTMTTGQALGRHRGDGGGHLFDQGSALPPV